MTVLHQFSIPVTEPFDDEALDVDVAATVQELQSAIATLPLVTVDPGTLHLHYPLPRKGSDPVAVITDSDLISRLVGLLTDPLPEPAPADIPHSDVALYFTVEPETWDHMVHVAGGRVQDGRTGAAWMVDRSRLVALLVEAGVPKRYLPTSPDAQAEPRPPTNPTEGDALTRLWLQELSPSRPVFYELRDELPDRWIRFHSLPESRRYAEDELDYLEIIRRHRAVLEALPGPKEVLLITCSWSTGSAVNRRPVFVEAIADRSWFWGTVLVEQDGPELRCVQLWVQRFGRDDPRLDHLFRMVADGATGGVMLADMDLRWVFAPYDGGADVIAGDQEHRDRLRSQFSDWLPADGGLL